MGQRRQTHQSEARVKKQINGRGWRPVFHWGARRGTLQAFKRYERYERYKPWLATCARTASVSPMDAINSGCMALTISTVTVAPASA